VNLTAENTAIVLDSTADFPEARERFPNWRVVPLYVNFGTDSFKDGVDLTASQFYERLKSSPELPTTSQPTPRDFLAV
jgi:fatty acid-binding protein DegV